MTHNLAQLTDEQWEWLKLQEQFRTEAHQVSVQHAMDVQTKLTEASIAAMKSTGEYQKGVPNLTDYFAMAYIQGSASIYTDNHILADAAWSFAKGMVSKREGTQ